MRAVRVTSPTLASFAIRWRSPARPEPVAAETKTARGSLPRSSESSSGARRSHLLKTRTRLMPEAPIWERIPSTASAFLRQFSSPASTTSRTRSAARTSASVDLKLSTRFVGSFWMNPTVSVRVIFRPSARSMERVVGSSVAKSSSLAYTPELVRALSSVDLPALV